MKRNRGSQLHQACMKAWKPNHFCCFTENPTQLMQEALQGQFQPIKILKEGASAEGVWPRKSPTSQIEGPGGPHLPPDHRCVYVHTHSVRYGKLFEWLKYSMLYLQFTSKADTTQIY